VSISSAISRLNSKLNDSADSKEHQHFSACEPESTHFPFFFIDLVLALFRVRFVGGALRRHAINFALLNFDCLRIAFVLRSRCFKVAFVIGNLNGSFREFFVELCELCDAKLRLNCESSPFQSAYLSASLRFHTAKW
jgi:hypothetical protein